MVTKISRAEAGDPREFGPHEGDPKTANDQSLEGVTSRLLTDIRSLQFASREVASVLEKNVDTRLKAFGEFLGSLDRREEIVAAFDQIFTKKSGETISLPIPADRGSEFKRIMESLGIAQSALPLSHRGLFLMLISKWDAFMGGILRCTYSMKPEILENSERSISFVELREIGSIEVARERIVEEEVGAVLRESHIAHFNYLEKRLGIKLRSNLDVWPTFVEITQRRHLIAHTDSRVTTQYLKICSDEKVALGPGTTVGRRLGVSPSYFLEACDVLTELAVKLCQVLWRQLRPDEIKLAEQYLTETTFEMVTAGQYPPAISILSFALQPPVKFTNLRSKLVCRLNLAQAYKWSGEAERCAKTVAGEDWSATNTDLRIAVAVLNDDFKHAAKLMHELGDGSEIGPNGYKEWPIFQEFRNSPEFAAAYKDIFTGTVEVRSVSADLVAAATKEVATATADTERNAEKPETRGAGVSKSKRSRGQKRKSVS